VHFDRKIVTHNAESLHSTGIHTLEPGKNDKHHLTYTEKEEIIFFCSGLVGLQACCRLLRAHA
jgi:hypothetical protein